MRSEKPNAAAGRFSREDILTRGDLEDFKIELIDILSTMMKEFVGQTQKKWLKSYEVRKLLNISPGTLQHMRLSGTIPYTKVGNILLYDATDIDKLLNEKKSNFRNNKASYR